MNIEIIAAITKAAVPQVGARRFVTYEVSAEEPKGEGWFWMAHRFDLAVVFDTFKLWTDTYKYQHMTDFIYSKGIKIAQPFWVRFR